MDIDFNPLNWIGNRPPVVSVVPLSGPIGGLGGVKKGLTLSSVAEHLNRAFQGKRVKAVALAINSPGGSPVQSALIHRRIRDLAAEHDKPVFAFCEDVAASGGYWLAAAADEIYADESSLVGSIGVVSAGFGFHEAIEKLGIDRRVHTSGEKKVILDSFKPERDEDVDILGEIHGDIHEAFKAMVRDRRQGKLPVDETEIFSGRFWTAPRAKDFGLVDALGHLRPVMRERFGDRVRFRVHAERKPRFLRRFGLARQESFGTDLGRGLLAAVEERLIWNRFGL
ncbi:MAG: S49 family peptidase [Magnetovibrionaceae bacterium]